MSKNPIKPLFLSIFCLLAGQTFAENDNTESVSPLVQYDRVLISTHDGHEYEIGIDGSSSISSRAAGDGHFIVTVNGSGAYYYTFNREEISTIKFLQSEDQSYIENLTEVEDEHTSKIIVDRGELLFHSSTRGQRCFVRSITGKVESTFVIDEPYRLSLKELPAGISMITVDNYTLKIMQ